MICYATIHTCRRWKWTFSCIVSWLLTIMTYHWSSSSSKSSYTSSSSSVAISISSRCVVMRYLIILHEIILWLRGIVLRMHNVTVLLRRVICGWYLVKMWCNFPYYHFCLHPIGVRCSFLHQIHCLSIFFIMAH
jgi:hypothetical protein